MAFDRQSNKLASSVSVLAITISLVAAQSATEKSLAQTATTPPPAGVTAVNGAGASTLNTLFVGTGTTAPFAPQGSWFNVFGVGNPPSLNDPAGIVNGPVAPGFTHRYASVGSSAGVGALFTQNPSSVGVLSPISFAASDDPLTLTNIERLVTGTGIANTNPPGTKLIQVPVVGVGIALAFNRNGLAVPAGGLRFSRATYCAIFNGNITNWNDIRIRNDNGGAIISPNLPLRVVRRSDGSGTTFVLTHHLLTVCQAPGVPAASVWNRGENAASIPVPPAPVPPALFSPPPYNPPCPVPVVAPFDTKPVCWPSAFIATSGGGNVARVIAATNGAIGYVDSATRLANNLPAALLQNRSGAYVGPTTAGIQHALSGGTIVKYGTAPNNRLIRIDNLANPPAATAYPISTVSYLLFYDVYANNATGTAIAGGIRQFINWALADATGTPPRQPIPPAANSSNPTPDEIATARGYAALPNNIKAASRTVVNTCVNTVVGPSPCIP